MDLLLVCATPGECRALIGENGYFSDSKPVLGDNQASVLPRLYQKGSLGLLISGIGLTNTALALGAVLPEMKPVLAVNFGICGAFKDGPALGEVVEIGEEIFGDLGAEDHDSFLSLKDMGFIGLEMNSGEHFYNILSNPSQFPKEGKTVRGISVNKVHGAQNSIDAVINRWNPKVESMEGAAFFQACLAAGIPFRQFRSVSNIVEPRNRASWKIGEAISNIQTFIIRKYLSEQ